MRIAIMQPYWFPYIGYWQLVASADVFVIYDNIQFTKKGWVSRNRFLLNGADETFSIALKAGPSDLEVRQREVSSAFDRGKLIRRLEGAYRRAPYFSEVMPSASDWISCPEHNLFRYINYSIGGICDFLGINTKRLVSSEVEDARVLAGKERVISLCKRLGATTYINPIGGTELYDKHEFSQHGLELRFLRSMPIEYPQLGQPFVPWLSILDVLMFNPRHRVLDLLREFALE